MAFRRLLAVLFPPAYRLLAVNLVAVLSATDVSDYYARAFFIVSLLVTFSGIAVSSQSYVVARHLALTKRVGMTALLLLAVSPIFYPMWPDGAGSFLAVVLAAFGSATFEVMRSDLAAKGRFGALVIQSFLATSALVLVAYSWREHRDLLVLLTSWLLVLAIAPFLRPDDVNGEKITPPVIKDVVSYSLSSGLSTGLGFALPILMERDLGPGALTELAQVLTVSSVFLLYPRYLSAEFLVQLQSAQTMEMARSFEKKIVLYVVATGALYALITSAIIPGYGKYTVFVLAILLTQVALPYSNIHSVLAQGHMMFKVNLQSLVCFAGALGVTYFMIDRGPMRAQLLMALYLAYVFVRNYLTRKSGASLLALRAERA